MRRKGIWLSLIFLSSVLVVPLGYSNAEMENQNESQTAENETSSQTGENETASVNASASAQENIGQQVSDFVHQATDQFKQQKNETRNAIKDCREKIKDATNDTKSQVADECHKNLQLIKEKYKDERQQFQELFKKFRESIIILRHEANGMSSVHDNDTAVKQINDDVDKNGLRGLENVLKHLRGMGLQHGKIGMERAMEMVNKTRGIEGMSSSNSSLSQNAHGFTSIRGDHNGNDKGAPDEGKGKK
ncbi:MAG: hypothetical protein HY223_03860 [Thaumarchaeota archaeon]|nr:hypothetical protein [Nitrososphaerota archaeon]